MSTATETRVPEVRPTVQAADARKQDARPVSTQAWQVEERFFNDVLLESSDLQRC
jgi:hypothetical protein